MSKRNREMDYQCDLVRSFDSTLKENGIPKGKRKKLVEELTFHSAGVIEDYMADLLGPKAEHFPYHEYAFGNVDWYYEKGYAEYDKKEKAESKKDAARSTVEKIGKGFPKSGVERFGSCYAWATKVGYKITGWLGGDFDDKDLVFVWAHYFEGKKVRCRVRYLNTQTPWKLLKRLDDDKEKYCYKFSTNDKVFAIEYMVDGEVFTGLCSEAWMARGGPK